MTSDLQSDNTRKMEEYSFDAAFLTKVSQIEEALVQRGYDPYAQLIGYLTTGKELYITRLNGAREHVKQLECEHLRKYLEYLKAERSKEYPNALRP